MKKLRPREIRGVSMATQLEGAELGWRLDSFPSELGLLQGASLGPGV